MIGANVAAVTVLRREARTQQQVMYYRASCRRVGGSHDF